jgi:hypothetical protein
LHGGTSAAVKTQCRSFAVAAACGAEQTGVDGGSKLRPDTKGTPMNTLAHAPLAAIRLPRMTLDAEDMHRPWEKHFRMAIVLSSLGFAAAVLWNPVAGAAVGAAALFVALRPLFLAQRNAKDAA